MKSTFSLSLVALITATMISAPLFHAAAAPNEPAASSPAGSHGKLPPFLTVGGLYYLDGDDSDFVKVLELAPEAGWIRVQVKGAESWVNVANLSTITPVSKETAAKSQMREKADFIRGGAAEIDNAISDYASKNNLGPDAPVTWAEVRKFLKSDATVYSSSGRDVVGRPYIFGKVGDGVKIDPATIDELAPVIDDPAAYWGKFKP